MPIGVQREGSRGASVRDVFEGRSESRGLSDVAIRRVQPLPVSHASRDLRRVDDTAASNVNTPEHSAMLNSLPLRRHTLPDFPHSSRHLDPQPPRLDSVTQDRRMNTAQEPRWQVILREPQLVELMTVSLGLVEVRISLPTVPSTALVLHGDHVWR